MTSDDDDELALAPIKPQTPLREKSNLSGSRTSKPGTIKPLEASSPTPQPPQILDNEHDHPPIVFLPNDTEVDIFPSSSPLFSPTQPKQTKRKRLEVLNFGREDDAQDDMVLDTNAQTMPPPPRMFASSSSALPPPPTFFAPSSPSVNDSGIDMDISVPEPSKSSVKKPTGRKKPPATEGAKKGGKTHNIDDDDFNLETERPQKKKKPEPKAKKSRNRHGDLEKVAIQTPKSKEFVVDDDEDLGNGSVSVPATDRHPIDTRSVKLIAPAAEPESALSSVPDSDIDIVPKKRGTKRKPTTKSGAQSKKKGGKGKGKLVVLSGDENDADADADVDDIEAERPVVLSDPDQAINAKGKEREDKPKDVDESNEGEGADNGVKVNSPVMGRSESLKWQLLKENLCPVPQTTGPLESLSEQVPPPSKAASRSYSIASRTKSTPMSELIRRVNSLPGSPFSTTPHRGPVTPNSTAYSPYLKSSRSTLSRIASLHPNRRTPPPPLPKPPPPKKTKKQLEQEEKWEEELQESVEGWATLTDEERAAMRRAKRAMAEGWDD